MDRSYFWEFILVLIHWNLQNFVMVLWIFQMELDWCKKLEVFFCGTVQLFAHFILCYRGMSLTSLDFFMCLELYIKSVISDNSLRITANLVLGLTSSGAWQDCAIWFTKFRPTFLWAACWQGILSLALISLLLPLLLFLLFTYKKVYPTLSSDKLV